MIRLVVLFLIFGLSTRSSWANELGAPAVELQQSPPVNSSPILLPVETDSNSNQTIPKSSAVIGRTLLDIVLDPTRRYDLPVTLLTALPVYSQDGRIALPSNTILTALIQKRDGGDYIVVEKAVYRGLNVPIPSEGRLIPAQIKPENYGQFFVPPPTKASSVAESVVNSNLVSALLGVALADSFKEGGGSNVTPLLLGVLGVDVGIRLISAFFQKEPTQIPPLVEIPKDSLIVFTVSQDIQLPAAAGPETPLNQQLGN